MLHLTQVEAICQPPSELFYNKTLTTAPSVPSGWRAYLRRAKPTFRTPFSDVHRPLLFYNVEGEESSPRSSTTQGGGPESKQNEREARIVVSDSNPGNTNPQHGSSPVPPHWPSCEGASKKCIICHNLSTTENPIQCS